MIFRLLLFVIFVVAVFVHLKHHLVGGDELTQGLTQISSMSILEPGFTIFCQLSFGWFCIFFVYAFAAASSNVAWERAL